MRRILISACLLAGVLGTNYTVHAQSKLGNVLGNLSQDQIGKGLKEALDKGIQEQVSQLAKPDGFFKNEMVKIMLPEELQKVDKTLRSMGMGSVADQGLQLLNRAAEDAVKEATPIFVQAIKELTFNDAKNILLGGQSSATTYLKEKTSKQLAGKFAPVIEESLAQVGATKVWEGIFTKYNSLPLVSPVDPNLTNYVTEKTMDGVFTMIAVEENKIRGNEDNSRSTTLLKDVFGKQDNTANTSSSTSTSTKKNTKDNTKKTETSTEKKKSILDLFGK
ncbi:DUF4197 domain-containing protein [Myroides odoratus]|uniref:DUF4197 domain-containing protein n=1 Tax=Myroides odoratus TaxID=256 RepID=A0A9Q7EA45_MYROD|nr:DUF4197 domain-containing protein [Myroides odoratus]EHQ44336.1 hypothetical protein Myrod_3539 [Myroides odoratus DSM 2801]EKB04096.1 hypothetical protein HMPREF9716_03348 [Myroides odoratus CIP 103059]QQU01608.1 DUF4197 domain-containing protein [Myroides odoratus]WQD56111.1 DUF4197 domain-containing protein [Myroides odoratus]STZ31675.1 Uncharacterised protein [Myroides odoratus]